MREFNAGEAIRKSKEWARGNLKCAVWPETIDWPAEIDDRPFKGAESIRGVWNRLSAFLNQLMESAEEKLIIVSYDGTLSVFYAMWLGLKIDIISADYAAVRAGYRFCIAKFANGYLQPVRLRLPYEGVIAQFRRWRWLLHGFPGRGSYRWRRFR